MQARGKFIVLEGIDGSGKRTQLDALAGEFSRRGTPFAQVSFRITADSTETCGPIF